MSQTRTKKTIIVKKGVYHTIEKGQTIYRIAKAYQVAPKALLRTNRISDPTKIKPGDRIFIPGAKSRRKVAAYVTGKKKRKTSERKIKSNRRGKLKTAKIKNGYFIWPITGPVTSKFGIRKGRPHDGLDISGKKGKIIRAAASGKVLFSDWGPTGYGNIVIIEHHKGLVSIYAHNQKNLVQKNKYVKQGEKVALLGQTGKATGPHLHFEIRSNRVPIDPQKYLP